MGPGFENLRARELAEVWQRNTVGLDTLSISIHTLIGSQATFGVAPKHSSRSESHRFEKSDFNDILNAALNIAALGEQAIKVRGAFGELPPTVKNVKNVLGIIDNFGEGLSGVVKLMGGLEAAGSESIAAASEILAGAVGFAEAISTLGPIGVILGVSGLAIGGVAAGIVNGSEDDKANRVDMSANSWEKFFREQERRKDLEKLIDLYDVKDYKQLWDVQKEVDNKYLVEDREKRVGKLLKDWEQKEDSIYRHTSIAFPELKNKWVEPEKKDGYEYLRNNFLLFLPAAPTDAEKLRLAEDEIRNRYAFNTMGVAPINTVEMEREIDELHKRYRTGKPATSLTYNDGSSFGAILNKTASVTIGPPATTTTIFPFADLQPFQFVFGQNGREAGWNSLAVSTPVPDGGVTGTIYYKKNILTNTLHIRGFLSANNAQNFAASPAALYYDMGSLPLGYAPNNIAYFTGDYFLSSMIKDDLGVAWIKHVTCGVNTGGTISINWIRPDIAIMGYGISFNTTIPLD